MNKNTNTKDMTHDEWLAARKRGIGGSDAGAILGLSKWKSPLDVYLDKIGSAEDTPDSERMYWGRTLEDIVAAEYEKRSGNKVRRNNRIIAHKDHDFILANLDREIVGKNGILECKTSGYSPDWGELGSTDIPEYYLAQVYHYMAVTDAEFADVAVLINGNDFRIYHIPRDQEIIDHLVEKEVEFWNDNVMAKVQPDPINNTDIKNKWPHDNGATLISKKLAAKCSKLSGVNLKIRDLTKIKSDLQVEIQKEMADHSSLADESGQLLATWKESSTRRVDTKRLKEDGMYDKYATESSSRTFRLKI